MKEYTVYVEMGYLASCVLRVNVEAEDAEAAEAAIQKEIDDGTFGRDRKEEISEQMYYGNASYAVCYDLTEECEE